MAIFNRWTLGDTLYLGVIESHAACLPAYCSPFELLMKSEKAIKHGAAWLLQITSFGVVIGAEDSPIVYSNHQRSVAAITIDQFKLGMARYAMWLISSGSIDIRLPDTDLLSDTQAFIDNEVTTLEFKNSIDRSMKRTKSAGLNLHADQSVAYAVYYALSDRYGNADGEFADLEERVFNQAEERQGRRFSLAVARSTLHMQRSRILIGSKVAGG